MPASNAHSTATLSAAQSHLEHARIQKSGNALDGNYARTTSNRARTRTVVRTTGSRATASALLTRSACARAPVIRKRMGTANRLRPSWVSAKVRFLTATCLPAANAAKIIATSRTRATDSARLAAHVRKPNERHCLSTPEGPRNKQSLPPLLPLLCTASSPDWECRKRELPSEATKLTCESLRARTNLQNRRCGALTMESECSSSYDTVSGAYRPCAWITATSSCEPNGQQLDCACTLGDRTCQRAKPHQSAAQPEAHPKSGDLSGVVVVVMLVASLVVCSGSCGLCWMGYRMRLHARGAMANGINVADAPDEQDEVLAPETSQNPRRARPQKKKYSRADETAEDQVTL